MQHNSAYEIDWLVSKVTEVCPETLVLCGDAPERYVERMPAIMAEILSPSTEHRDATINEDSIKSKRLTIIRHMIPISEWSNAGFYRKWRFPIAVNWQSAQVADRQRQQS